LLAQLPKLQQLSECNREGLVSPLGEFCVERPEQRNNFWEDRLQLLHDIITPRAHPEELAKVTYSLYNLRPSVNALRSKIHRISEEVRPSRLLECSLKMATALVHSKSERVERGAIQAKYER
jgi:hypothetical protein